MSVEAVTQVLRPKVASLSTIEGNMERTFGRSRRALEDGGFTWVGLR